MEGCLIIAFRRSVNSEIRAKNKLNVNSNLWHIAEYDDFINFRVSKMTYIVSGGALNSTHSHWGQNNSKFVQTHINLTVRYELHFTKYYQCIKQLRVFLRKALVVLGCFA